MFKEGTAEAFRTQREGVEVDNWATNATLWGKRFTLSPARRKFPARSAELCDMTSLPTILSAELAMIPRGELDIELSSLIRAAFDVFGSTESGTDECFDPEGKLASCLSVRSALDGVLSMRDWPTGSEILMSAVNIPAMSAIVVEHNCVPVPVDVSPSTLAPDLGQVQERITEKTRAILVAHLFGSRIELSAIESVVRQRDIELWEDVAQGFHRNEHLVESLADISFFSFGLIKTQTALGGALVRFKSADEARRFREVQFGWPRQRRSTFAYRILRALLLKCLGKHACYTIIGNLVTACGYDFDVVLSESLRGFRSGALRDQLRYRPCVGQVRLLARRLAEVSGKTAAWKASIVADYERLLPANVQVGRDAPFPGHWVYPILSRQPSVLRDQLWRRSFDATVRGSQLRVIPASPIHPKWDAPQASEWVRRLLYLPLHRTLTSPLIQEMASVIAEIEGSRS